MSGPLNRGIPGMSALEEGLRDDTKITMTRRTMMMLPLRIRVFSVSDIRRLSIFLNMFRKAALARIKPTITLQFLCRRCWQQGDQFHCCQIEDTDVVAQSTAKQFSHDDGRDYNAPGSIRTQQAGIMRQRSELRMIMKKPSGILTDEGSG